jgi:ElaB/YqjD/DUF883 family membrane-anchored ribosome-binding protein
MNTTKLACDLDRVVRDSEELLHTTAGVVGDKAHEVRARLSSTLEAAKESCREAQERALGAAKATDQTIRDHPYKSIGVGFGIGVLLGVLLTRK